MNYMRRAKLYALIGICVIVGGIALAKFLPTHDTIRIGTPTAVQEVRAQG